MNTKIQNVLLIACLVILFCCFHTINNENNFKKHNLGENLEDLVLASSSSGRNKVIEEIGVSNRDSNNSNEEVIEVDKEKIQARIPEKTSELRQYNFAMERLKLEKDKAENDLDDIKEERDELKEQENDLSEKQRELESKLDKLKQEDEESNQTYKEILKEELDSVKQARAQLSRERRNMDDLVINARQKLRELKQKKALFELEWKQTKKRLHFVTQRQYIVLLSLQNQIKTTCEHIENLEVLLDYETKKKKAGESTAMEVDKIKLEKEKLNDTYRELISDYENKKNKLLDTLGYSIDEKAQIIDLSFDIKNFNEGFDFHKVMEAALEEGLQMHYARKKIGYEKDNLQWVEEHHYFTRKPDMKEIDIKEAEEEKNTLRSELHILLERMKNDYEKIKKRYVTAEKELTLKEDLLQVEKTKKDLGETTSLHVAEVMSEKNTAKRELLQVKYEAYLLCCEIKLLEKGVI